MSPAETQLDVLAIFSHPDDAELSVAGTLLKLKKLGYRTGVCDMTRGEMGTRGTPEIRAKEALDAARIMKLDVRVNLEQPDGHAVSLGPHASVPPVQAHAVTASSATSFESVVDASVSDEPGGSQRPPIHASPDGHASPAPHGAPGDALGE